MREQESSGVRTPKMRWGSTLVAIALAMSVLFVSEATVAAAPTQPKVATLSGTVTWSGGPDARAVLGVGACPADEQGPNCPSLRTSLVAADGSYELVLPFTGPKTWNVAAFVAFGPTVVIGPVASVSLPRPPRQLLPLSVSARVVGASVLDGDGNPFPAGTAAVMATPTSGGDMLVFGADADGNVYVVLDPTVEYDVNAFATNTGWPNPWVAGDGTEFHFSNGVTVLGADLLDGTIFTVQP